MLLAVWAAQISGAQAQTYTFTNAGATGRFGPTQSQADAEYASTALDGKVLVNGGIQYWKVPQTGLYRIEALGAQGYGTYGGRGAHMTGEFMLTAGDTLKILVGQAAPIYPDPSYDHQYGGGGGSFITMLNNTPLLVAGGGGGNHATAYSTTNDAQITTSGAAGTNGATLGAGGTSGMGGEDASSADGGGGLLGDGDGTAGGAAFVNGGEGGATRGEGGFGGGGGTSSWNNYRAGGGGGYSGGGAANNGGTCCPTAGGGGSYNAGANQINLAGVQTGHGQIIIEVLSSGATNDAGIVSIDSPNVYCPGVHNVVATVQNFGANVLNSVTLNWSVDGVLQTPVTHTGLIDTIGGANPVTAQVTLGSYSFTSAAHQLSVWTSQPNSASDTVGINDSMHIIKQSFLPPPTNLTLNTLNPTSANISWSAGSLSNTWLYMAVLSGTPPAGVGSSVAADNVQLTSLSPRTSYDFYVREVCPTGDTSAWAGPLTFTTPCLSTLSGTYTVNPSLPVSAINFVSLNDAAFALSECGISGPVTINVAAGTYNTQLTLLPVQGASSVNTITFDGGDSSQTIITHDASVMAATVLLDGADWITLRNLKIESTGGSPAFGVLLTNQANYNTISNCWVRTSTSTSSSTNTPIAASASLTSAASYGDNANYSTIIHNKVEGGYYNIRLNGTGSSNKGMRNQVVENIFTDAYYYATYFYYQDSFSYMGNNVSAIRYSTFGRAFYGVYLDHLVLEGNTLIAPYTGIYLSNINQGTNDRSLIANNICYGQGYYSMYCTSVDEVDIFNNTIVGEDQDVLYMTSSNAIDLRNNILVYRGSSNLYQALEATTSSSFIAIDDNIYYSTGTNLATANGGTYASIVDWQAAQPQYNENSESFLPPFVGANNFHISSAAAFKRGEDVGLALDVDNNTRCAFAPSVGADESRFAEPLPVAAFGVPDTAWLNSPTAFYNGAFADESAGYAWSVDGVFATDDFHFNHTFTSTGTYTIKLVMTNCGGMDSVSKTVIVANQVRKPAADLIADQNTVEVYETVNFTDVSGYGPTSWEWIISPALNASTGFPLPSYTYLDGTDQFSQNPVVSFDFPGTYDVCLVATNALGSDTMCYNDYVEVQSTNYMCIFPNVTNEQQGIIFDAGGPLADYSNSSNCNYLIDPCAGSVTLSFSQFDLASGDYLRAYDGEDNTGTPLWDVTVDPQGMSGTMSSASFRNNLVAQSGKLYLEFESTSSTTAPGFEAQWTSTPSTAPAPVVSFDLPDTACVNIPVLFENLSSGDGLTYSWDLYNDQFPDAGTEDFQFTFNTAGTYALKLTGENCGGTDSVIRNVVVVTPQHGPQAGFMVRNQRPAVNEVVTLQDTSTYCADNWEWTITPSTYRFVNGTNANDRFPQVIFADTGYYDVKLVAGNSFGQDSIIRSNYFFVINYCRPIVASLSGDVGISRVQLQGIDQESSIGSVTYTDYTAGDAAVLKTGEYYHIMLERQSANNAIQRAVWIDYNQDGDFEVTERVLWQQPSYSLSYSDSFQVPRNATLGATRMRVGASFGTNSLTACGPVQFGEYEDYLIVIAPDVTAPVITLLGSAADTVAQCEVYVDPGATALDNIDGDISGQIIISGTVDESVAGTYTLYYNVDDVTGNPAAEVMRTVVVLPDAVAPVIALNGSMVDSMEVMNAYTDPGAIAVDNCDDTVAVTVSGMVDVNTVGTYILTYTAQDSEGNVATEIRTVVVGDVTAPTVSLQGTDTMHVQVDSAWMDPGVFVQDNYDTSFTVTTTGAVNTNVVGTYTLTYCVSDAAMNGPVCKQRVVIVEDLMAPMVTMIQDDTLTVEVFSLFIDPGVAMSDNYYANSDLMLTKSGTWPNHTKTLGEYTIEYTVSDPSGNSISIVRIVQVVDTKAPQIWLNGDDVVYLTRWTTWTDPGVEVEDNYDSDNQVTISVGGSIDLSGRIDSPAGQYFVTYQAIDKSGNRSNQVVRLVNVLPSGVAEAIPGAHVQVYPNPTLGRFTLKLELAEREQVRISVLNSVGQEVQVVEEATLQSAQYEVDLSGHRSGLYFVRVQTEEGVTVKKVTLQQ